LESENKNKNEATNASKRESKESWKVSRQDDFQQAA
jgi:hypothetical protein